MLSGLNPLIAAISALLPGMVIGYLIRQVIVSRRTSLAESKAQQLLADSKSKAQDIVLDAKNQAIKLLEDAKKEEKERHQQTAKIENLLTRKEAELDKEEEE